MIVAFTTNETQTADAEHIDRTGGKYEQGIIHNVLVMKSGVARGWNYTLDAAEIAACF